MQDWQNVRDALKFKIRIQCVWKAVLLDFFKGLFFHQSVVDLGVPVLKMK